MSIQQALTPHTSLLVAAAAAVVGYSLYCWRALSLERQSIEAARKELARAQSNNTSAPVLPQPGGSAQPRSWKSHLTGLDKMISELLVEARLLASELNKGGDPMAVVLDPLAATATAERRFMSAADAAVVDVDPGGGSAARHFAPKFADLRRGRTFVLRRLVHPGPGRRRLGHLGLQRRREPAV